MVLLFFEVIVGTSKNPYSEQLRGIAELILAVAGESVTVMKRNAPERALKLKRHDEWGIYLEFLKVMFNLTDRLSVCSCRSKNSLNSWTVSRTPSRCN